MLPSEPEPLADESLKAGGATAQCLRLTKPLLPVTGCGESSELLCPSVRNCLYAVSYVCCRCCWAKESKKLEEVFHSGPRWSFVPLQSTQRKNNSKIEAKWSDIIVSFHWGKSLIENYYYYNYCHHYTDLLVTNETLRACQYWTEQTASPLWVWHFPTSSVFIYIVLFNLITPAAIWSRCYCLSPCNMGIIALM